MNECIWIHSNYFVVFSHLEPVCFGSKRHLDPTELQMRNSTVEKMLFLFTN